MAIAPNLENYEQARATFKWEEAEKEFTWNKSGKCNIVYEAIDRKCEQGAANDIALYYSDGDRDEQYTYEKLQKLSNRFARGLKSLGVAKGDRVFIFLPRTPEYYVAMLGTIRIGAIAGPLFEAFMEKAVKDRLEDSEAKVLVTSPELLERVPLHELPELKRVIIVGADEVDEGKRQVAYQEIMRHDSTPIVEWLDKEDAMMIHYTSGSTGKPKGVLLSHYAMVHMYISGKWVYDLKPTDIYWCVADPGWITGTSAGMWAPWLNGTPVVMRGGRFNPEHWYETLAKHKVTVWFSAPTAFRMLMAAGTEIAKKYDLSNLRHILSAGEPLNPELIKWGMDTFGVPIYDNWWMTETGSSVIANFPALEIRPGSMGKPIPGIEVEIVNNIGTPMGTNELGNLAIKPPWPGLMKTIWNNPSKYADYFVNGWYISGDSAYKDEDGYYWFEGRIDDVINTMGERVGPFEVESKLVEHPAVAEAGVIGVPDPVRGEVVKAYITLRQGFHESDELKEDIMNFVRERLAAHARPRIIEVRNKLPKTRSGKIMRRVLKAKELNIPTGDVSTIDD
ncbi:acetate--CoA ligase [Desulfuribacillus alkaliarsenatis]|nr:acetate--CoA ligase [Desulfuribacillus alkaliarsenatis]